MALLLEGLFVYKQEKPMPLSRVQYEADGSTDTFSVTFPYLSRVDVKVSVGGVATSFSWPTDGAVKLTPVPTSGSIVDINRETEKQRLLVDFQDGSTLLEKDLDLAARQSFFLAQETFDQTGSSLVVAEDGSYSASGRRISVMGYPTAQADATNKQYVDDTFAQGEDTADARDESRNWANYPEDQLVPEGDQVDDYSAMHHSISTAADALSTASDADESAISASEALNSENAARDSELAAGISEVNAKASEDDVAANALAAGNSETNASTSESNALSSANAATSEATNSENSASSASISESNASQSATTAGSQATNSANSASASDTSASNSSQSAVEASTSKSNAASSANASASSAVEAQTAETNAEAWAASVDLPSAIGNGEKILRQKSDETGFEYIGEPYSKVETDDFTMKGVAHGTNSTVTRPVAPVVYWIGSVAPANGQDGDLWYDTST